MLEVWPKPWTRYTQSPRIACVARTFTALLTTPSWFFLSRVEVTAPPQAGAIATFGDSITDGYNSTPDTNNRWTDHLARRLMAGGGGSRPMGVLNQGIAGNRVLVDFVGPSALARFDRDVLAQSGVTHVILLEGLNDLGLGGGNGQPIPSADDVIAGYKQILARAHSHGIKVIAGTMTPFEGTNLGAIAPDTLPGDASRGERTYAGQGCAACHILAGQGKGFGPELTSIGLRRSAAHLRESIVTPQAKIVDGFGPIMPTFQGQISEDQILQLLAFIKSLQVANPQSTTPAASPAPTRATAQATPRPNTR